MELRMERLRKPLREFTAALAKFQEDLGAFLQEQEAGVEPEVCGRRLSGRRRKRNTKVGRDSDLIEILTAVASSVQPLRDLVSWALEKDVKVEVKEEPMDVVNEEEDGNGAFQDFEENDLDPDLSDLDLPFILHPDEDSVGAESRKSSHSSGESESDLDLDPKSDPDWNPSSPEQNNHNLLQPKEEDEASGSKSVSGGKIPKKRKHRRWPLILQDPSTGQFICPAPSCGTLKRSERMVRKHMREKHPELRKGNAELSSMRKECPDCGKNLSWNSFLQHQRRHEDEREGRRVPFLCDKCPATFKGQRGIDLHMQRIHAEEERTWICDKCGKEFRTKLNLSNHIYKVHPVKAKVCSHCGAKFKNCTGLNNHVKEIHLKIKPLQCPDCPSVFAQSYKLKRHQIQVHVNQGRRRLQTQRKRKEESSIS